MAGCGYSVDIDDVPPSTERSIIEQTAPTESEIQAAIERSKVLGGLTWGEDFSEAFNERSGELAKQMAGRLRQLIAEKKSLLKSGMKGSELDIKRTVTASLQYGGKPLELYWLKKHMEKRKPPKIYFVIDHTGSMDDYIKLALLVTTAFAKEAGNIPVTYWLYGIDTSSPWVALNDYWNEAVRAERGDRDYDADSSGGRGSNCFFRVSNRTIRVKMKDRVKFAEELDGHGHDDMEFPNAICYLIAQENIGREFLIIVLHDSEQYCLFPNVPVRKPVLDNLRNRVMYVNFSGWNERSSKELKWALQHFIANPKETHGHRNWKDPSENHMYSIQNLNDDSHFFPGPPIASRDEGGMALTQVVDILLNKLAEFAAKNSMHR
jgi:hypothetical protein